MVRWVVSLQQVDPRSALGVAPGPMNHEKAWRHLLPGRNRVTGQRSRRQLLTLLASHRRQARMRRLVRGQSRQPLFGLVLRWQPLRAWSLAQDAPSPLPRRSESTIGPLRHLQGTLRAVRMWSPGKTPLLRYLKGVAWPRSSMT